MPSPDRWTVAGDFVVSCDDGNDSALAPDIAAVPLGSPWSGSLHAVWHEYEEGPYYATTIHYSMSKQDERGLKWSNDEPAEGDRTISEPIPNMDAENASVAVDIQGYVHVVWCQQLTSSPNTYEAFYRMSYNNGLDWTAQQRISYRKNGGYDSHEPFAPKIDISDNYLGQKVIHVVWSELDPQTTRMEVMYSRSADGGNTWTGTSQETPISSTSSEEWATDPDISVGGNAELVHVVWSQLSTISWSSEVYYTRSTTAGASTWTTENAVSFAPSTPDDRSVGRARVTSVGGLVMTIWDQPIQVSGQYSEICISVSTSAGGTGSWNGANSDIPISFHDGNWGADPGSLDVIVGEIGTAYAVWTEYDETSPFGSSEIYYSMSTTPSVPASWSGRTADYVLSTPDGTPGEPTSAVKPAVDIATMAGKERLQIAWSEPNSAIEGDGGLNPEPMSRGGRLVGGGNEIHYIPETTFDIPISTLGWSFISVPLVQYNTSIAVVLDDSWGDGSTTWDRAIWYNPSTPADPWKQYNTAWPSAMNDLTILNHKMGVWVNITAVGDGLLTGAGNNTNNSQITLKAGWNLIGYPALDDTSYTVANLKTATGATIVEGYNANATYKTSNLANTYVLKRGKAYWVLVPSETTWTVNW